MSSFVHHFKSIGEFKLELQSGNAQLGNWRYFVPCDLEIEWMTLENSRAPLLSYINRAPFLYYIKLCAAFQSHKYIKAGVTVRKPSILVKIGDFCPVRPRKLMDDLEKQ